MWKPIYKSHIFKKHGLNHVAELKTIPKLSVFRWFNIFDLARPWLLTPVTGHLQIKGWLRSQTLSHSMQRCVVINLQLPSKNPWFSGGAFVSAQPLLAWASSAPYIVGTSPPSDPQAMQVAGPVPRISGLCSVQQKLIAKTAFQDSFGISLSRTVSLFTSFPNFKAWTRKEENPKYENRLGLKVTLD